MQKFFLAILTFVFLVVLAPVFMFSMLAPTAFGTILTYWTAFVLAFSALFGGMYAFISSDLRP